MSLTISPAEIVEKSSSPLLQAAPGWSRVEVGEVASVLNGAAFKSEYFNTEGQGLPLVRIRDVGKDSTETAYSGPFEDRHLIRDGDLLVGMDGDFRIAEWHGGKALLNQRVCKLSVEDTSRCSAKFLLYVLPGYLDEVHRFTSSVTVKHLSSLTVKQIPIPLPLLHVQDALVEEIEKQFTRLDVAVGALHRSRANLNRYRSSVLLAAADGSLIRSSQDADWEDVKVEEVAKLFQYGTSAKATHGTRGVPVLGMGNIDPSGSLKLDKLKYLPGDHKDLPKLLLNPGDVLFNRTNSAEQVGKTAVYEGQLGPCTFASYLIRVRLEATCSPHFLTYVTNSAIGRRWVKSVVSQQVGQANVSGGKFKNFCFRLPPRQVQDNLVERAQRMLSVIHSLEGQVKAEQQRSRRLRQAILFKALSGQLVENS